MLASFIRRRRSLAGDHYGRNDIIPLYSAIRTRWTSRLELNTCPGWITNPRMADFQGITSFPPDHSLTRLGLWPVSTNRWTPALTKDGKTNAQSQPHRSLQSI